MAERFGRGSLSITPQRSVFVQVFLGYVILRHLVGVHFLLFAVLDVFDTRYDISLKRVPFLEQFADTFRIGAFNVAQPLQVPGLQT